MGLAGQVLAFMLVSINEWKIPFGYFFINGLSIKKAELLNQCFNLLFECDMSVMNVIFGAPINFSICKNLDNLDVNNLRIEINKGVFIFPDPSHM